MKIEEITKKIIEELKIANQNINFEENSSEEKLEEVSIKEDVTDIKKSETEFLTLIKERILVLFEGLNNFEKGDIEARVELNLKFMEFLLANKTKL